MSISKGRLKNRNMKNCWIPSTLSNKLDNCFSKLVGLNRWKISRLFIQKIGGLLHQTIFSHRFLNRLLSVAVDGCRWLPVGFVVWGESTSKRGFHETTKVIKIDHRCIQIDPWRLETGRHRPMDIGAVLSAD